MATSESRKELEQKISAAATLPKRPVVVAFLDVVPAGVQKFGASN